MGSEKRYVIPRNGLESRRLGLVQETIKAIQGEHPEMLSLCVFGSTTYGRAKEESDIDGWQFIDAKRVAERLNVAESDVVEIRVDERFGRRTQYSLNGELEEQYNQEVRGAMKNAVGLSDDQVEHLRCVPISIEILNHLVGNSVDWDRKNEVYADRVRERNRFLAPESGLDIMQIPPLAENPGPADVALASRMFHLAVGRGIEPFRSYFIARLEELGPAGERIWREVIGRVEETERFRSGGTVSYPKTMDEAKRLYSSR